jgi:hypothetical protein
MLPTSGGRILPITEGAATTVKPSCVDWNLWRHLTMEAFSSLAWQAATDVKLSCLSTCRTKIRSQHEPRAVRSAGEWGGGERAVLTRGAQRRSGQA